MTVHPGKRALDAEIRREDERYRFEERAAILEFDAGFQRDDAERRARELVYGEKDGYVRYDGEEP
jgi:hypothetical protein